MACVHASYWLEPAKKCPHLEARHSSKEGGHHSDRPLSDARKRRSRGPDEDASWCLLESDVTVAKAHNNQANAWNVFWALQLFQLPFASCLPECSCGRRCGKLSY